MSGINVKGLLGQAPALSFDVLRAFGVFVDFYDEAFGFKGKEKGLCEFFVAGDFLSNLICKCAVWRKRK